MECYYKLVSKKSLTRSIKFDLRTIITSCRLNKPLFQCNDSLLNKKVNQLLNKSKIDFSTKEIHIQAGSNTITQTTTNNSVNNTNANTKNKANINIKVTEQAIKVSTSTYK